MASTLDEAVCTLYAKVSWTMTTGELLVNEGDESGYGSISVQEQGSYVKENRKSSDEASSLEIGWPYTSGHYKNGAIGLYNMGLTCCLNSLLQMLYMNREFTDILQELEMPEDAAALEGNVPYQLLILFEEMQCSRRSAIYPYRLVRCLQSHGLKLSIQYDAAELFMIIWNLIIGQITKPHPPLAERLSSLCTIHVQRYLTCLKCLQERTSDSSLIALPLLISDPRFKRPSSLEEALVCFFQPFELTEENMCLCQNCGEKTTGLQGVRLKTMPHTLTLHLKRLHYGKSPWVQKISRRISFPLSLDLNQLVDSDCVRCEPGEQAFYVLVFSFRYGPPQTQYIAVCFFRWGFTASQESREQGAVAVRAFLSRRPFGDPQLRPLLFLYQELQGSEVVQLQRLQCEQEILALTPHRQPAYEGWLPLKDTPDGRRVGYQGLAKEYSLGKVSWDDVKCTFGNAMFHWGETAYLLVYVKAESK